MKHKKPPVPVIVLLIVALLIGGYYGIKALTTNGNVQVMVSGTIETTEITISPEIPGKVVDVFVQEGAQVKVGDPLFRLDDSMLQGQRVAAEAALNTVTSASETAKAAIATARSNYELAADAARLEAVASRTMDWASNSLSGYSLPGGYFSQQELLNAAIAEVDAAQLNLDAASEDLNNSLASPAGKEFIVAEEDLLAARLAEQIAQDVLARSKMVLNTALIDLAQVAFDEAKTETESAQAVYDGLKNSDGAQTIISARLGLSIAKERFETAQDHLLKLQFGDASPKLQAAKAALDQAELAAAQSEAAISQAQAQLALIDLQISKVMVLAPTDGVILTRSIEPGEMVSSAASALKIGCLDSLTITVFVPEDIYGTLFLGQAASLKVDSYPGESFSASILHIAEQAEFTPRNVQTVEGRKATVFAVRLQVNDPSGKLKPGMPADITFEP
ncbi:MAG: efflux RND transporter periplasmic adaptor subunit [Chloroflexota bacterium]